MILALCSCSSPEEVDQSQFSEELQLRIKSKHGLKVGEPLKIFPELKSNKKYNCLITVDNGLVIKTYQSTTNKILSVSGDDLTQAGRYVIKAIINSQVVASRSINLVSREIVHPLYINSGPKKIIVDGKQESMITIIPSDTFNNAIVFNTNFSFSDSKKGEKNRPLENLVSNGLYTSDAEKEKLLIGVSNGSILSREQAIYFLPDWADDFKIKVMQHIPYADNRQYLHLKTSLITDPNGNIVANGTRIIFKVMIENKISAIYNAFVIDGYATVYIRNPKKACTWDIVAQVHNADKSNTIKVNFDPIIDKINYTIEEGFKQIKVGPVRSVLGQTIPDGTEIVVHINDQKISEQSRSGTATIDISNFTQLNKLEIEISGVLQPIPLDE